MLLASATPLAMALVSQYGFGLHPCELCIWQRYPYVLLIAVAVLAIFLRNRRAMVKKLVLVTLLLWLVEGGLAFYHVGVEQSWWASESGCSASGKTGQSIDQLRAEILASPLVACDQPEFYFLGLTMAGWNLLLSLGCALASILLIIQWRPRDVETTG